MPARNLSTILPAEHAILAETLSQIENVTVVVVNLIYDKVFPAISGFGHLIPSCEDYRVLGIVYDSCSFPQLDSQLKVTTRFTVGHCCLRYVLKTLCLTCILHPFQVLIGGAWFDELQHENTDDNDYYLQIATDALKVHLGINLKPVDTKVSIQRDGIPQYTVGHSDRIEKIFHYINHHNLPLSLIGSSYKGISVCDCIFNASMAAEDIIKNSCYMD